MEPEEYYDSLDEDSNYGSIDNEYFDEDVDISCSEQEKPRKCFESKEVQAKPSLHSEAVEISIPLDLNGVQDDIVPFYGKNLNKSEVNLDKSNEKCNIETGNNKAKKRLCKKKSLIPIGKLKSKSYLDMFHAKTGIDNDKESVNDSSQAICSELTPTIYIADEDSDRNSCYSKSPDYSENNSFYEGSNNKNEYSLSLASLDSKFCSVSQQNLSKQSLKSRRKKTFRKPAISKIPELGGLGPEIPKDKLETLKKRQLYGQKVSENNKIRMEEKRLLQSLQQEIKRCNNT